jgi:hypothetical protein
VSPPPVSPPPPSSGGAPTPKAFAGVSLQDGYTGTVDFKCSAFLGTLDMKGAPSSGIAQNDPYQYSSYPSGAQYGGQISVTSAFTWNAGSINAGPLATKNAFLNLMPTATGIAAPLNGGTVNLGSTVTTLGNETTQTGSTFTIRRGIYHLLLDSGFVAAAFGTLVCKADPIAQIIVDGVGKTGTSSSINVEAKGKAEITCDRADGNTTLATVKITEGSTTKTASFENSGTTTIHDRTSLQIGETAAKKGSSYLQVTAGAKTVLEAGSKITCVDEATVRIGKGTFEVQPITVDGVEPENQPEAVIDTTGVLLDSGLKTGLSLNTEATLTMPGSQYGKLRVKGDFYWIGEVKLALARDTTRSDQLIVTQDITVSRDFAKLTLRWGNQARELQAPPATWVPIRCVTGSAALPKDDFILLPPLPLSRELTVKLTENQDQVEVKLKAK